MCSNEFSQIEVFHFKEALFGNMVKPVWNPSILLEKGSGRLCLINQGLIWQCCYGSPFKTVPYDNMQ